MISRANTTAQQGADLKWRAAGLWQGAWRAHHTPHTPPPRRCPPAKYTQNTAQTDATPSCIPAGFPLPASFPPVASQLGKVFLQPINSGSCISQVCLCRAPKVSWQGPCRHGSARGLLEGGMGQPKHVLPPPLGCGG